MSEASGSYPYGMHTLVIPFIWPISGSASSAVQMARLDDGPGVAGRPAESGGPLNWGASGD